MKTIINRFGEEELICDNAKYNAEWDSYICECCGKNELTKQDFKRGMEVRLKKDNTIWFVANVSELIKLVPTKSNRHKNCYELAYPYELEILK